MTKLHTLTGISPDFVLAVGGVLAAIIACVIAVWVAYRILTHKWLQAGAGLVVGLVFVVAATLGHA